MSESKSITIELVNDVRLLINEPDFITDIFFEPLSEKVYAKHLFTTKPIYIGLIPKEYVNLLYQKLIVIKSWKLLIDTREIQLNLIINDYVEQKKQDRRN